MNSIYVNKKSAILGFFLALGLISSSYSQQSDEPENEEVVQAMDDTEEEELVVEARPRGTDNRVENDPRISKCDLFQDSLAVATNVMLAVYPVFWVGYAVESVMDKKRTYDFKPVCNSAKAPQTSGTD